MAFDKTKIDTNLSTTGINRLPAQMSAEVWQNAREGSAIMQLAREVKLPSSGLSIPIITGDPTAEWVGETEEKPVSKSTFKTKIIKPYKMAVIELFSEEFLRDQAALYDQLVERLPYALAKKFDQTVFTNVAAPGSDFDQLHDATQINVTKVGAPGTENNYKGLLAARTAIANNGGILNGWVISPQLEASILSGVDVTGRPIAANMVSPTTGVSNLLGAPVMLSRGVYKKDSPNSVVGFAGDWTQAAWGSVEGITFKISSEATVNDGERQINLWQRNMFAVLVEFEIGFVVGDKAKFVVLTEQER